MKSKMKYAVLVLVIGLLGLVIFPSSVFAGLEYTIEISDAIKSDGDFKTAGKKPGTRFNPFPKGGEVFVELTFVDPDILPSDEPVEGEEDYYAETGTDTSVDYPNRCFRWSPLEDDYWDLWLDPDPDFCPEPDHLQTLDEFDWEFHHIKISGNSLSCRFDLFYDEYEGAWDHYVLGINMEEFVLSPGGESNTKIYTGVATINWTHYTEKTRPRGKAPDIEFQQLKYTSPGEFTITITITEAEVP